MILRGLALIAAAILLRELYLALGPRRSRRRVGYEQALLRARETGKPLVVLGSPSNGAVNGLLGPDYGCGDLCIDLGGCAGCPTAATGPAETVLGELADDSAVVFVSCTLEYVDDVDRVWGELLRVSGGDLYVVTVEPLSLTAWFYPGARQVMLAASAGRPLRYKRVSWGPAARLPEGSGIGRATIGV